MAYTLHLPEVKRVLHLMYAYKMSGHTKVIIFCINCEQVNSIYLLSYNSNNLEKIFLQKLPKIKEVFIKKQKINFTPGILNSFFKRNIR